MSKPLVSCLENIEVKYLASFDLQGQICKVLKGGLNDFAECEVNWNIK